MIVSSLIFRCLGLLSEHARDHAIAAIRWFLPLHIVNDKQEHTAVNDYCMAVGVMLAGSKANGWSQNANGYDCPKNNNDWSNAQYSHQSPDVLLWLR